MSNTNTGGPAFPTTVRDNYDPETGAQWSEHVDPGMTLRDYFAAQALTSINLGTGVPDEYYSRAAKHCYALADAMLKAREQ